MHSSEKRIACRSNTINRCLSSELTLFVDRIYPKMIFVKIIQRHKLEQVCREQQKIMKSIKSESLSKIRDEEEKRKETTQHFQQSINEIFTTLGKNNDENTKLKEANLEITKKYESKGIYATSSRFIIRFSDSNTLPSSMRCGKNN